MCIRGRLSILCPFTSVFLRYWNPPGLLAFLFNAVGGCLLVIWSFIVASFIKLHPQLKANGELTTLCVPGYPWLPWLTVLALVGLTVLFLSAAPPRHQVSAVLILTAGLIVIFHLLPGNSRRTADA